MTEKSQGRARLEALIEQERLQEAIDIRSAICEKYGTSIPCHIFKHGNGINYTATLMFDDDNGTIFAVTEIGKFDRMYNFFKRLISTPTDQEMDEMEMDENATKELSSFENSKNIADLYE